MLPIVTALVTRRQRLAPVREHSSAARARTLPRPDAVPARQRLRRGVPLAVEEVSLILAGCGIVADDLEPSHLDRPDAAVCGVHDEVATRRPVVHVAGEDSRGGNLCAPCRLALGDPTADEHIEAVELRRALRCARDLGGRDASGELGEPLGPPDRGGVLRHCDCPSVDEVRC